MDTKPNEQDLPHPDQSEIEAEAERSRKALDERQEHGTDPLNEGP